MWRTTQKGETDELTFLNTVKAILERLLTVGRFGSLTC